VFNCAAPQRTSHLNCARGMWILVTLEDPEAEGSYRQRVGETSALREWEDWRKTGRVSAKERRCATEAGRVGLERLLRRASDYVLAETGGIAGQHARSGVGLEVYRLSRGSGCEREMDGWMAKAQ
jgi:hypothetical protein